MLTFFSLMTDLYFLILAVIVQICNPTAELVIPTRTAINKVNAEIERQKIINKAKKASVQHDLIT